MNFYEVSALLKSRQNIVFSFSMKTSELNHILFLSIATVANSIIAYIVIGFSIICLGIIHSNSKLLG